MILERVGIELQGVAEMCQCLRKRSARHSHASLNAYLIELGLVVQRTSAQVESLSVASVLAKDVRSAAARLGVSLEEELDLGAHKAELYRERRVPNDR